MTLSAEHGSMAEVGSPVDLPPDPIDRRQALGWASGVVATASLLLLVLNAHAIGAWFDELTPTPLTARLQGPVAWLTGTTARAGLDGPRAALHGRWEKVRAARFGAEQPGESAGGGE